ncbi:MAG: hypothetical protein JWQ50_6555 [Caballeronia mineralivorans]|jgi:hypothetical protein|nr:hypothetical protein [Caballeronia mineralivorans]MEA3102967.1 hypothetical protein [Caballeronia mineralivorans]
MNAVLFPFAQARLVVRGCPAARFFRFVFTGYHVGRGNLELWETLS